MERIDFQDFIEDFARHFDVVLLDGKVSVEDNGIDLDQDAENLLKEISKSWDVELCGGKVLFVRRRRKEPDQ